jgi:hypothetical protein
MNSHTSRCVQQILEQEGWRFTKELLRRLVDFRIRVAA